MRAAKKVNDLYTICGEASRLLSDYAHDYGTGNPYVDTLRDDVHLMGARLRVTPGGEIAAALLLQAADNPDDARENAHMLRAICCALHWVTGTDM
jgi:hypothetical protein